MKNKFITDSLTIPIEFIKTLASSLTNLNCFYDYYLNSNKLFSESLTLQNSVLNTREA